MRAYTIPLTICVTASVHDDRDAAADRAHLRAEHASALVAQHGKALVAQPTPSTLASVAANGAGDVNPHLARFMKACGLTAADVRKHGPEAYVVNPEILDIARDTAARETSERKAGR